MVYVDDMRAPFGRLILCHMIADTHGELLAMAHTIGVSARWLQHPDTAREHFDISLSKRKLAVTAGAVEITWRQSAAMVARRRETGQLGPPHEAEDWYRRQIREALE